LLVKYELNLKSDGNHFILDFKKKQKQKTKAFATWQPLPPNGGRAYQELTFFLS
jgi:hypothetical protein